MDDRRNMDGSINHSTGSFLASLSPKEEFEKAMECPVCNDLPLPPIYTCQTGHIICIKCKPKLKNCSLCKMLFTKSRNFPLESMVLTSTFYCTHRDRGCNVKGTPEVLKSHREACPFRPISCFLFGQDKCKDKLHYVSDFVAHLKDQHNLVQKDFSEGKPNVFDFSLVADFVDVATKANCNWKSDLFTYDNQVFVTKIFNRGPMYYFKLAVIEDGADSKYSVKITIQNKEKLLPKYELTTEVPSIRQIHKRWVIKDDDGDEYGAVDKELLSRLSQLIAKEDSKPELKWKVRYELQVVKLSRWRWRWSLSQISTLLLLSVLVLMLRLIFGVGAI